MSVENEFDGTKLWDAIADVREAIKAASIFSDAQVNTNAAAGRMFRDYAGNIVVFRAAFALLAAEATPRTRERLNALLENPLKAIRGVNASPFAAEICEAATGLKEELDKA